MSRFIQLDILETELRQLGKDISVSHGEYRFPAHCAVRDLDWNHMDQNHRPWIHNTYEQATRIYTDRDVAVSLTRVPMGPFRFLVQMTDIRIRPGLFYQCYSLFSLIYIHGILRNSPDHMVYEWYITSPWYMKFLHPILSRKIWKLNHVQIAEDVPVRVRRADLRKKGYSFGTEEENYLNSNTSTSNTVYPAFSGNLVFELNTVSSEPKKLLNGVIELLVCRENSGGFRVWNSVCPHEGGPLDQGKRCGEGGADLRCPWHGLRFRGILLNTAEPKGRIGNLDLALEGDRLIASSTAG